MCLICSRIFYFRRRRSLYLGSIELTWAVAGAIGPVIGGALTQAVSWRWIYWINLPVCGTTFALLLLFLDVHNPRTPVMAGVKAIDWFGNISILGLVVMLLLGLDFGGVVFAWNSPQVICLVVFGCLMSSAFIYSEKHLAKYPLMPLSIFKNVSNIAVLVVAFSHGVVCAPSSPPPFHPSNTTEALLSEDRRLLSLPRFLFPPWFDISSLFISIITKILTCPKKKKIKK